jgi:hypothetical protein
MSNGEGSGPHDPTDQDKPTEGEIRAADEWEGRERRMVEELHDQEVARLNAEEARQQQAILAQLDQADQAVADRIESVQRDAVLAEEARRDQEKLRQLRKEQQGIQAMKWEQERALQDQREIIANRFRKLVGRQEPSDIDENLQSDDPEVRMRAYRDMVDKIRLKQGLPLRKSNVDTSNSEPEVLSNPVDKHQAMRDRAADSI